MYRRKKESEMCRNCGNEFRNHDFEGPTAGEDPSRLGKFKLEPKDERLLEQATLIGAMRADNQHLSYQNRSLQENNDSLKRSNDQLTKEIEEKREDRDRYRDESWSKDEEIDTLKKEITELKKTKKVTTNERRSRNKN